MAIARDEIEIEKIRASIRHMDANIEHMRMQNEKLAAETTKVRQKSRWYLLVVGSGATLAIVAIAKLFL
ncbi:MAG: hypothetical protein KDE35_17080 [Geminicoccaceae bacterium]|nr:hypothetical protein [Geminicoccaceae bacterium]